MMVSFEVIDEKSFVAKQLLQRLVYGVGNVASMSTARKCFQLLVDIEIID
jgi:hypothetical protein